MTAKSRINAVMFADGKMVTANSGTFAVTVDAEVNRRQNAVMVDSE